MPEPEAAGTGLWSRLRVVANLRRDRNLRKLLLAYSGYKLTELASWIVILVFAYERGGVLESGVAAAIMLLPSSLIVPFVSAIGDRGSRPQVLAIAYVLMALSAIACAVALFFGLPDWIVYGTMFTLCTSTSFSQPLQSSTLVVRAATVEELTAANVVSGLIESLSYFAGPLLAALLLPRAGAWVVFAVLGAIMSIAAGLVLCMDVVEGVGAESSVEEEPPSASRHAWQEVVQAWRWATGESDAQLLIALLAGQEVLVGVVDVLFVAIAFDLLGTGDAGAAWLNAAFGLGLVGGALVSVSLVGSRRISRWLVVGGVLASLPLLLLAGTDRESMAIVLLGAAGVGVLLGDLATRTLFQRIIPPYRIGETYGVLESVGILASTVGVLGAAGLIDWLGVGTVLSTIGGVLLVVVVVTYLPIHRLEERYGPPPAKSLEALLGLSIFRPLGALAIDQLARSATLVEAEAGRVLIRQGEAGGPFFVLLEGTVEALVDSVPVRTQGAGEYFGEISSLQGIPRTATIVARTPVVLLEVEPELFVQAVSSHPGSLSVARGVARARRVAGDAMANEARG